MAAIGKASRLRTAWRGIERYASHPDPQAAACNRIALIVASNQPLYPLFVQWAGGNGGQAAMLTWLSTPLFLAVPALARSHSPAGRSLLTLAGLANTLLALALLGPGTGAALFLAPCLVLAGIAFRSDERSWALPLTAIAAFACLVARYWPFPPAVSFEPGAQAAVLDLNMMGAGSLLILIGFSFAATGRERTSATAARRPRLD